MTVEDMVDLLHIYDAKKGLENLVSTLVGAGPYAFGFEEGIIGKISLITDVILRYSPTYDPDKDLLSQPVGRALDDTEKSYEERSLIILGLH